MPVVRGWVGLQFYQGLAGGAGDLGLGGWSVESGQESAGIEGIETVEGALDGHFGFERGFAECGMRS